MSSLSILYEDFVDHVSTSLSSTIVPSEPTCFICGNEYGNAGPGLSENRDFFNELPANTRTTYVQNIVEPVMTPCGHTFCTLCICMWLLTHTVPNCPICREHINIPDYSIVSAMHPEDVAIDAFSIALGVSAPVAAVIYRIVRLSTRELMGSPEPMSFVWYAPALISDLPRLMVTVARRFHYQSTTNAVPPDLMCNSLHNPLNRAAETHRNEKMNLEYFSRADAPISKHPDAQKMYTTLVNRIEDVAASLGNPRLSPMDWPTQAEMLFRTVRGEMRDADGGVGEVRWWMYVWYVCKTLVVWQGYCEHVKKLAEMQVALVAI
ncbi:hypothetical protein BDU57DRAFT_553628 [Ampelomyces quisqualis]|uniref:RING-type domain-containing protein n=1 Tax=Ampelomyces quisqualis TaxID=50730 RepID=A0A6A5R2X4_AMPQU|nr:hypothetical protein BDU57DRAFT_553628 [Ampelomyces quisqualis]